MKDKIRVAGRAVCFLLSLSMISALPMPLAASAEISREGKVEPAAGKAAENTAEQPWQQTTEQQTAEPAKAAETVRVGWYEDSYHISGENGERSGYAYEYEQNIAAYTGWNYEYIEGDWGELLEKLENGEIDIMASMSYTEDRAAAMLFSDLPMGTERYYLYADLKNTDISAADLSTLNGRRIGVMEQSVQATEFTAWEEEHRIETAHIDVDSVERATELFENREIDGVISTETPIWVDMGMSAIAMVGGSNIYYGISKSRPDLKEELDNAMRAMENENPFYADDLYKRYLSSQALAVLTKEEKDWLAQHGDIRIGWVNYDAGISTFNEKTGEMSGVINDYVVYASDCLEDQKLNFTLICYPSEGEQLQALKNGDIDLIFHAGQNPYYAERNDLALSNTVLTYPLAVVTAQDYFDENAENTVAVEQDNLKMKWYLSYNYPDWKIIDCDSYDAAEKMVKSGQADCMVVRCGQLMQYVNDRKMRSMFLRQTCETSFAVLKGNTELLSILNKTLKNIQTSKLSGAVTMYEDSMKKVTLTDFIKDNLSAVLAAFLAAFAIILSAILVLLKKARIAEAKAKEAMVQAEAANAAKSEFLFNMSHDIRTPMNALLGYNRLMKKDLTDPKLLDYQEKIEQSGNLLLSIINNVLDMARIESGKTEIDENYSKVGDILKEICEVFDGEAKKKDICLTYEMQVEHEHIMCDIAKISEIFTNLISNAIKYTSAGGTVTVKLQEIPCALEGYINLKTEVIDNGIGMSKDYLPKLYDSFSREHNTTIGKAAGTGLGMPIVKRLVDLMGGSIVVESELGKGSKFTVILQHKIADEAYYEPRKTETPDRNGKEILRGKHILLAEDNDLNAEIATAILEEMEAVVDRVQDGIQCISRLDQMPAGTYDLILMDIQMPNMDGYKATQSIRHFSDPAKAEIPIIAMTANAFEEDKKMAFARGMNGHIAKPIDAAKMMEVMLSIVNKSDL